ncbi:MAG: class I SAM-dependent methyltransferase [Myxococcota bacterium]|nr:class I SAM-dependent methyltransferase [Myxococcota bacterium]
MSERDVRDRLSLIAHAAMPLCNPLSTGELDALLGWCDFPRASADDRGARVLDLGAGRGDVGLRCARRFGASVTLVDVSPIYLAEAASRAREVPDVDVVREDAATYLERAPGELALAICLGATHALGGIEPSVRALGRVVCPGGAMLIGDLVALGPRAAMTFDVPEHAALRGPGARLERVAHELVVGPERMRAYEDAWTSAVERHLDAHPDDAGAAWARARIAWMREHAAAIDELAFAAWLVR